MKCCDSNQEKDRHAACPTQLSGLALLGTGEAIFTCLACFTPLAVTLFGVIGLARWAGHLDHVLFPLLAICVGLLLVGFVRQRPHEKTTGGH